MRTFSKISALPLLSSFLVFGKILLKVKSQKLPHWGDIKISNGILTL